MTASAGEPKPKPCVLVVDDHARIVRAVQIVLERRGYRVVGAKDGIEGLDKAFEEKPDVIILDIIMPVLDGYEVAKRLKRHRATRRIPIIMLTATGRIDDVPPEEKRELHRRLEEQIKGFDAGAVEFLTKPIEAGKLVKVVEAVLKRYAAPPEEEEETG